MQRLRWDTAQTFAVNAHSALAHKNGQQTWPHHTVFPFNDPAARRTAGEHGS